MALRAPRYYPYSMKEVDPPVAVGMLAAYVGAMALGDSHPFIATALGVWATWCLFYYVIRNQH